MDEDEWITADRKGGDFQGGGGLQNGRPITSPQPLPGRTPRNTLGRLRAWSAWLIRPLARRAQEVRLGALAANDAGCSNLLRTACSQDRCLPG